MIFGLRMNKATAEEQRNKLNWVAELLGISNLLHRQPDTLSGGEKQRIEIARSLCINPSVLLLDEATSALDAETEAAILNNIRHRGCACVMVAHRLTTIMSADRIFVIRYGEIVQQGTHNELKDKEGLYKELLESEGI